MRRAGLNRARREVTRGLSDCKKSWVLPSLPLAHLLRRQVSPLLRWLKARREPIRTPYRARAIRSRPLVSLVSVWVRNWCYLCGTVETVAECETVEIANIHAVFTHVAENMLG
jgi:hypothetical protein